MGHSMNTKRLKELLVDRCEEDLKDDALALFNEIEEALRDASREADIRRFDELQRRFSLKDGARVLPQQYDTAILRGEKGLLVYSAEKCVGIIYAEMMESIRQGWLDLYGDDMDAEESAWAYAVKDYEFNVSGDISFKYGPLFLEDREEEDLCGLY